MACRYCGLTGHTFERFPDCGLSAEGGSHIHSPRTVAHATEHAVTNISNLLAAGNIGDLMYIANHSLASGSVTDLADFLDALAATHIRNVGLDKFGGCLWMIASMLSESVLTHEEEKIPVCLNFLDKHGFDYNTKGEYALYGDPTPYLLHHACHRQCLPLIRELLKRDVDVKQLDQTQSGDDVPPIGPLDALLLGEMDGYQFDYDQTEAIELLKSHGAEFQLTWDQFWEVCGMDPDEDVPEWFPAGFRSRTTVSKD